MKQFLKNKFAFFAVFILFPLLAKAQTVPAVTSTNSPAVTSNNTVSATLQNPLKVQNIGQLQDFIFSLVLQIGVPIAVIMLLYSGFMFVTARGNPEALTTARRSFMWTVIGTAILLGASVISGVITGTIAQIKS